MSGTEHGAAVAVIGLAGRFPGAWSVDELWRNLRQGVHSITFFGDQELAAAGVDPALLRDPRYVRAGGVLEGYDLFDPAFFGYSPREAELLDPQHRLFLETAWEALENAGHAPGTLPGAVGVYAGASTSGYLHHNVLTRPDVAAGAGAFQLELSSRHDFLATRAAHRLNLRGPALTIQTGCSTGLVSIHVACQAILAGECDFAVAGGVAVKPGWGYMHSPGGIMSPDGHCRPFDARAGGTVGGSGVALVVLRRLDDALADGDTVHAVIRGSAVNNDGAQKAGFTAPSVDGQAAVIEEALAIAGVDPATVGFVEAHGSGTELGDPVEVAALVQAFGGVQRPGSCALGSVKSNVGHLDTAAGAAGLIKAVFAVEHGVIPPTLHYREPNPRIDFAASPFFVNAAPIPWPGATPRRAGVSSFGIGGTNAHVVLEQAPAAAPSAPARGWHLLTLSARTAPALEAATDRLAEHLRAHPEQPLADVAFTLQVGRRAFEHRRVVVARDGEEAASALASRAPDHCFDAAAPEGGRPVAFLFPGLGNHYPRMGRGLYEGEPVFRHAVDRCAEILRPFLGLDLREVLYPPDARDGGDGAAGGIDLRAMLGRTDDRPLEGSDPAQRLNQTRLAQVALFVTEYALARQWMGWGVRPAAMIGHSLGEYVAATVAGVWSLEDGLMLVAERARLIHELPEGGMMGVTLPEAEVRPLLRDGLCIATLNGPAITVVSGPVHAVDALQAEMTARGVFWRRVNTRHAFHSTMMEPVAERLAGRMRAMRLNAPSIPFVSNITRTWIRPDEATDPAYWTRHLCGTVRFSEGAETLCAHRRYVLLEVGPGQALRTLIRQLPCFDDGGPPSVASLRHAYERRPDVAGILGAAGRLWAEGVPVDWKAMHAHERLRRVPLPTYPFERRRCWIEPGSAAPVRAGGDPLAKKPDPADWLYLPAWTRAPLPVSSTMEPAQWLVLADGVGIGSRLAGRLEALGHTVAVAEAGDAFGRVGDLRYTARPGSAEDLQALRDALQAGGVCPRRILHLWGIDLHRDDADAFGRAHARGHATVAALARAFARDPDAGPLRLLVATERAQDVSGGEPVRPERAAVMGACLALPREHPHATCRVVDVHLSEDGAGRIVDQLLVEAIADAPQTLVALRGPLRWARSWQAVLPPQRAALREGGAWLFSGALAAGGDVLAEHLAGTPGARIAFLVDPAFPRREDWDTCLASPEGRGVLGITIRGIRSAEARGCRTLLLHASPDDAAAVKRAVDAAREEFDALHGVVHAVYMGAAAQLGVLADAPSGDLPAELVRVARELDALDGATAHLPLELRLLQGSLFSVVGGPGLAGATAACVVVDAWAQAHAARGGAPWTSVSWDRWQLEEGGEAGADRAIVREDGARAFGRVAALAGEPRVVVSTCDLSARIQRLSTPSRSAASAARDEISSSSAHSRPGKAPHPPNNEAEELLVGVWRDLLGIGEIGIHDDFFELGGHSLLGMQVLSRIREIFQVELPLRAVFEGPTIAGLAELVDQAILLKLEEMTDEEAESTLAGLSRPAGFASLVEG